MSDLISTTIFFFLFRSDPESVPSDLTELDFRTRLTVCPPLSFFRLGSGEEPALVMSTGDPWGCGIRDNQQADMGETGMAEFELDTRSVWVARLLFKLPVCRNASTYIPGSNLKK